jgi:hypothetical protein
MQQQENDGKDVDTIIDRLFGRTRGTGPSKNSKFASAGFVEAQIPESSFFPVYNLSKDKWKDHQSKLRNFFVGNPSPNSQPCPSTPSSCPSPVSAGPTAATFPINIPVQLNPTQALILLCSCSKLTP